MQLNVRFLCCLLIGVALAGAGTHFLHGYQVKRNAGALLVQASRAEQEAEAADPQAREAHLTQAVHHLHRYLAYRPADAEARARLGNLLEKLARSPEDQLGALLVYDQVLRRDPGRSDIRRRAIRLAMDPHIGRYTDALDHLHILEAAASRDGELQGLCGQCQEALGHYPEARDCYARAIALPPVPLETYVRYSTLLRRQLMEPQAADGVMAAMIRANRTAPAYLALSEYWKVFDPTPAGTKRAAEALAEARKQSPDNAEVLLQSADLALREGDRDAAEKARKFLRRGIALYPRDARMSRALAAVEVRSGRQAEAIAALRRGLQAVPGESILLWDLADLLVGSGDGTEVHELIDQLQKAGVPEVRLEYLRARLACARGEWREAADALERVRPELEPWPDLVRQTDLVLGACYEQLGDRDQQYSAYHRVMTADPLSVPGGLGLGAALEALGKTDEALKAYQVLLADARNAEVRLRMARLLIRENQERPRAEQQWDEVDRLLDQAAAASRDAAEKSESTTVLVAVVRAQALAARGQPERAEVVLTEARDHYPKDVKVWVALASLAEQNGRIQETSALLTEGERAVGDTVDLRLARAAFRVRQDGSRARPALAQLAQGTEKFSLADRKRLLRGLATAHARAGDRDGAVRLWSRLAGLEPADLGVRVALFDLAQEGQDRAGAARAVEEIRRIEGSAGVLWKYARAAQLVEEARAGSRDHLAEARGLLETVMARRPGWARAHLCAAMLEELAGHKDVAIARYTQAIDLGDHSPSTIRQAVQLLYERRRFADADAVLKKLPHGSDLPEDLQRLTADVWLNTRADPEQALDLARKSVPADSKDYRAHLWLGQRLSLSEAHRDEAEKELRRALDLAPTQAETWVALVEHLARTGKKDEAEALIAQARAKLPPGDSRLARARCYEAVGQADRARALYQEALTAQPNDVGVLTSSARFYLRSNDPGAAEACLTRVVQQKASPEEAAWARRALAFLVHARGGYQDRRKALALLGVLDNTPDGTPSRDVSPEDVRARAFLLATQWEGSRRREAIRLLEALAARQPLTPDDQFLLGKLYESLGQWSAASKRMSAVLSAGCDNPSYLAVYVDSLLRHKEWEAASTWLARLETRHPASLVTVQLKARLLSGQGKGDEAAAKVLAYAATRGADLARAARLLETIDRPREAEELFRKYVAGSRQPEAALVLATFHGRQGHTAAALDECARAAAVCPAEVVAEAYMEILAEAPDPGPHCAGVERWVEQAGHKDGNRTDFTPLVAALRYLQGRYQESAALYRSILVKDPYNARALNNLAYLLALKEGKGQEALHLLDRAQEYAGPSATLADTRAVVHLLLGNSGQAVAVLDELVANAPSAGAYFHLAQAHELARDRNAARDAFLKARELRLKPTDLSPPERPGYEQMARLFGTR